MNDVNFDCPSCEQNLDLPDDLLGQTVACPVCHEDIKVRENTEETYGANLKDHFDDEALGVDLEEEPVAEPFRKIKLKKPPKKRRRYTAPRSIGMQTPSKRMTYDSVMEHDGVKLRNILMPIHSASGWIKFLGVMSIVAGIGYIMSVAGILLCWLPFWLGATLFSSASSLDLAMRTEKEAEATRAFEKLATSFRLIGVLGILVLAGAVASVLTFIFAILPLIKAAKDAAVSAGPAF